LTELSGNESDQWLRVRIEITIAGIKAGVAPFDPFLRHQKIRPTRALIIQGKEFLLVGHLKDFGPGMLFPGWSLKRGFHNTGVGKLTRCGFCIDPGFQKKRFWYGQSFRLSVRIETYFIHQHLNYCMLWQSNVVPGRKALTMQGEG
jgi:hypothetical protein